MKEYNIKEIDLKEIKLKEINLINDTISNNSNNNDNNGDEQNQGYIQDGLVLHLDGINKGDEEGYWTDLVRPDLVKFQNVDAIATDIGWKFNSYNMNYLYNIYLNFPSDSYSIEICFKELTPYTDEAILYYTGIEDCLCACLNQNSVTFNISSRNATDIKSYEFTRNSSFKTLTYNIDSCYENGVLLNSNNTYKFVIKDVRVPSIGTFNGYIYSIRIYDRKLTMEEIEHNSALDNERFNIN